jgi:DNA mismatch repair ATPase MutS
MSEETKELEINLAEEEEAFKEIEAKEKYAEKLKKLHSTKRVFCIEVEDEDTGEWKEAWFRKPKLKEFSMFTTIAQKDKIQALQTLMRNIFIDGDKNVIDDDDYFLSAMSQVEEIVNVQASKIKKF